MPNRFDPYATARQALRAIGSHVRTVRSTPVARVPAGPSPLDRKLALRDLFEGCADFESAWQMAGYEDREQANRIWSRWQRQMDETGSYVF